MGFTLTELLVACALLSTVSAGGLAAFTRARATWQDATVEARLHERAQYAFATLEPELQMAGYFGSSATPAPLAAASIPETALACGLDVVRRIDRPVEVAAGYQLACAPQAGGALAGSQQLTLRRAAAHATAAVAGRGQWWNLPLQPALGAVSWNGAAPIPEAGGGEARDLLVRIYYVARGADGDAATPALRVKSLTSIAGRPAFIDTEVMPGVESLHAEILPSPAAPRSLRLTFTVRPDKADLRPGAPRRLTVTRHFTLRNAARG